MNKPIKKILVINGSNLNLLGTREPGHYGNLNLEKIEQYTKKKLQEKNILNELNWFQSNIEGEIINKIHEFIRNKEDYHGLIINPGGYSHTSVSILDALKMVDLPKIEVHISSVFKREEFRQSYITAQGCDAQMSGCGIDAYWLASVYLVG